MEENLLCKKRNRWAEKSKHHGCWYLFWSVSCACSLQMLLTRGNIALMFICELQLQTFIFAFSLWIWLNQLGLHLSNHCCGKKQPKINLKGTDRPKFSRSPPVSSLLVLQMSRQLRRNFCFFSSDFHCFPSTSEYLLGGEGMVVRHAARDKGRTVFFFVFFLTYFSGGRMSAAYSTVRFPSKENKLLYR